MENKNYYVGLDIGTDSIGYAATDESYNLLKYKGKPVWGTHIIEEAKLKSDKRQYRTARRRLDRKQQRVTLIKTIFAKEISKIDPDFFKREEESSLLAEDSSTSKGVFAGFGYTDKEYYNKYPTIHHLIVELMKYSEPHDVRLVYLACSWLVAHRGHFLSEVDTDTIRDGSNFKVAYDSLMEYFEYNDECEEPVWGDIDSAEVEKILAEKISSKDKKKKLTDLLYEKKKISSAPTEEFPFSREGIIKLLCGGTCDANALFGNKEISKELAINLSCDDLEIQLSSLGEDAELILRLKAVYDCASLYGILNGHKYISEAKTEIYEQHKSDLEGLKKFIKKYLSEKYNEIFREVNEKNSNYCAYSGNIKSDKNTTVNWKTVSQEDFCKYIKGIIKNVTPAQEDKNFYDDMVKRVDSNSFMPKQVIESNRVIPCQLYYVELEKILYNAEQYLPFLNEKDEDGYITKDKILSVFKFRIPYYVGPLNKSSPYSWLIREPEKITPWNFSEMVNEDECEQNFIKNLIGECTYLPGEKVIPKQSLLYQRFTVLNEINNITINGVRIKPELKQQIYNDVFKKNKKVTVNRLKEYLISNGKLQKPLESIGGIDNTIKSSLSSYLSFRNLIENKTLSETEVEEIIYVSTYTESRSRFKSWLTKNYHALPEEDINYITSLKFKDFGRLSRKFLCEIIGSNKETGEAYSIIDALWKTDKNLMELLSDSYSYSDEIKSFSDNYLNKGKESLEDRMDAMYLSNAVKRPIYRVLEIVSDIVKAEGKAPEKIFIEMARGSKNDEKGKRTESRVAMLEEAYKKINTDDIQELIEELNQIGDEANSKLQSEKLFLYYSQLGKCMYSGEPINLEELMSNSKLYDIDHIYPQSKVKDDSLKNNKVLVKSQLNAEKSDKYPISSDIQEKMTAMWKKLLDCNLITTEKYRRLTRTTRFTDDEALGFINRQLVETRHSTKAVATLLKELYPDTEIVYVKAGLVSDFRHEKDLWTETLSDEEKQDKTKIEPWKTELWKSRTVNDLHHAKDAYLNIVAGNVYHEKCTRQWYLENKDNYSIKTTSLFGKNPYEKNGRKIWDGVESLEIVKKTMQKNIMHYTIYSYCKKGQLFDQNPLKKKEGLFPLKKGLDPAKYGGYDNTTASFFVLVKYWIGKKSDVMFVPVELAFAEKYKSDPNFRTEYVKQQIKKNINSFNGGNVEFPLGDRIIKINTMIELDGYRMCITGKSGRQITVSSMTTLCLSPEWEFYIKKLETFLKKKDKIIYNERYDYITKEKNMELYDILTDKLSNTIFIKRPTNPWDKLTNGRSKFDSAVIVEQAKCLCEIIKIFGRSSSGFDLTAVGGASNAAKSKKSANLSNWKKDYSDVRIIDTTASGLFERRSGNLLNLL